MFKYSDTNTDTHSKFGWSPVTGSTGSTTTTTFATAGSGNKRMGLFLVTSQAVDSAYLLTYLHQDYSTISETPIKESSITATASGNTVIWDHDNDDDIMIWQILGDMEILTLG